MDDDKIISLYWQRDEEAIAETQKKYGRFCYSIAYGLLKSKEDAEECENDTYLDAWNAIPPQKPKPLSTFLAMITRRRALDYWRGRHAQKRESQMHVVSFEELEECIPVGQRLDERIHVQELAKALSVFLRGLSEVECNVFLRRNLLVMSFFSLALRTSVMGQLAATPFKDVIGHTPKYS